MSEHSEAEAFEKFKGTKLFKKKPPGECVALDSIQNNMETNWIPIKYESLKDLAPYYPYIISLQYYDSTDSGNSVIVLSSKSFVDIEEERALKYYLSAILKAYNRRKRKNVPFNKEETLSNICWYGINREPLVELIERVEKYGKKATYDGVHLDMAQHYRRDLQEEIVRINLEEEKRNGEKQIQEETSDGVPEDPEQHGKT